jgi:hypothetical protein
MTALGDPTTNHAAVLELGYILRAHFGPSVSSERRATHDPIQPGLKIAFWLVSSPHELVLEIERKIPSRKNREILLSSFVLHCTHESMEIMAPPTSLRLAPPPASVRLRRTALRTSFLKGSGAFLEFVSHVPVLSACLLVWEGC